MASSLFSPSSPVQTSRVKRRLSGWSGVTFTTGLLGDQGPKWHPTVRRAEKGEPRRHGGFGSITRLPIVENYTYVLVLIPASGMARHRIRHARGPDHLRYCADYTWLAPFRTQPSRLLGSSVGGKVGGSSRETAFSEGEVLRARHCEATDWLTAC